MKRSRAPTGRSAVFAITSRISMNQASLPFLPFVKPEIDEATIAGVADVLRSGWIRRQVGS